MDQHPRTSLNEADIDLRKAEREARRGDDPSAFYGHLARQGHAAVHAHFAPLAHDFISSMRAHRDAYDHWLDRGRHVQDTESRKKSDADLMAAADRYRSAGQRLSDATNAYNRATGGKHHVTRFLHRGENSVEDHTDALAHLSGIVRRPTVEHTPKHTHITLAQHQDPGGPWHPRSDDLFVSALRHHYKTEPKITRSGSTKFIHAKLPPTPSTSRPAASHNEEIALARTPLRIHLQTEGAESSTSCGVFIPLPFNLAKDFPDKSEFDTSEPHYTVVYVGDLTPDAYANMCRIVREVAKKLRPFQLDLSRYGEFENARGQKIAHMQPGLAGSLRLAVLHGILRRAIMQEMDVEHYSQDDSKDMSYEAQFKPHATLAYLPADAAYAGPKPTGSWRVTEIECWGRGYDRVRVPLGGSKYDQPVGLTREPMAISYPMAVPEVEVDRPKEVKIKVADGKITFEAKDQIPGGLADKSKPGDFDKRQLQMGRRVEREHTKDPKLAREIAMDHLKENPRYYTALKKMEKQFEEDKIEKGVHPLAFLARQRARDDERAGHDAAEYWRGWAAGSFLTANGSDVSGYKKQHKKRKPNMESESRLLAPAGRPGLGGSDGDIGLAGSLPMLALQKRADELSRKKLRGLQR